MAEKNTHIFVFYRYCIVYWDQYDINKYLFCEKNVQWNRWDSWDWGKNVIKHVFIRFSYYYFILFEVVCFSSLNATKKCFAYESVYEYNIYLVDSQSHFSRVLQEGGGETKCSTKLHVFSDTACFMKPVPSVFTFLMKTIYLCFSTRVVEGSLLKKYMVFKPKMPGHLL